MAPTPFGAALRSARQAAHLTLRQLGTVTTYSHTYLWELERGKKTPSEAVARALDEALDAHGTLIALAADDGVADRITHAAARPRAVDLATVDSLHTILAHQRRLEDTIGSGLLLAPTLAQVAMVEGLAAEARGPVRRAVVDMAGQWSQFAGWLHVAAGRPAPAREWFGRTLEYADEVGNADLAATALSMRGNMAWRARQPGPLIGLSDAARQRADASPGVRALAAQQQARGHALVGEVAEVDRRLDEAEALAGAAAADPGREPPWVYFWDGNFLRLQRGLAYHLLGRDDRAVEQLRAGLAGLPGEVRRAEWAADYVLRLAVAHGRMGDGDEAARLVAEVRAIADATGSPRLAGELSAVSKQDC